VFLGGGGAVKIWNRDLFPSLLFCIYLFIYFLFFSHAPVYFLLVFPLLPIGRLQECLYFHDLILYIWFSSRVSYHSINICHGHISSRVEKRRKKSKYIWSKNKHNHLYIRVCVCVYFICNNEVIHQTTLWANLLGQQRHRASRDVIQLVKHEPLVWHADDVIPTAGNLLAHKIKAAPIFIIIITT